MKMYRISSVEPVRYPVLSVTFDDELTGEIDLTDEIRAGSIFAPLVDEALFRSVGIARSGRSIGWNLDEAGKEIDLGADGLRIDIETQQVQHMAERYRRQRTAAE